MAELEEARSQASDHPSRKKRVFAFVRHPVRSVRAYLDACSVKSAFFFYSLIGALAAFFISAVASMALASLSEDVLFNGSGVYPGLYIYDEEENALVKAEDMSWYEATEGEFTNYADGDEPIVVEGVSLYIESRLSKSESRYVIPLDDMSKGTEGVVVHDMDERIADQGEARDTSIPLDELPAYDAAANAQRGNVVALETRFPSDFDGNRPAVSLVGYYVYVPTTGSAYQVLNLLIIAVVPIVFGVCFILASHAFYKRKLQRPIQEMDEAARRIAEGDLSVSMPAPPEGSRSELDCLCASFETMRDA
ncbi:MAG: HAMP domain-containing protein [Slackia sp.]